MKQDSLLDLAAGWVKDARFLREHGASEAAATTEKHAEQLTEAVKRAEDEALTLEEAATASGYARRTLREKVSTGEIPNAGEKGRPRIRRGDLPRRVKSKKADSFDATTEAQEILGTGASI